MSAPVKTDFKQLASRRTLLLGAGGVALAGGAALTLGGGSREGATTPVGALDSGSMSDLGDGFYLVDGWVLSAQDVKTWRLEPSKGSGG